MPKRLSLGADGEGKGGLSFAGDVQLFTSNSLTAQFKSWHGEAFDAAYDFFLW